MVQLVGKEIGTTGYGLMGLTWRKDPPSTEQSFKAMKAALKHGATFWNGGEIYGSAERNSLHLLNEYFTKYPEDADKVILSIKGGIHPEKMWPDGSEEGVRRSIDNCLKLLDGKKKLDLFECARVDPSTPIEETVKYINRYVQEGKLGGISLSEVGAESIRKAAKAAKISAVEVEYSIANPQIETNGIAKACAELNIPIVAYSPLSRGLLSGTYERYEDIPQHLMHMPQFADRANFEHNLKLAHAVSDIASKKGVTKAQIAMAWVKAQSGRNGMPVVIPIPGATTEERIAENMADITLSEQDLEEIAKIQKENPILGDRYGGPLAKLMNGGEHM